MLINRNIVYLLVVLIVFGCTKPTPKISQVKIEKSDSPEDIIRKSTMLTPSPQQYEWQKMEFLAFVHFGVNTFTGREWGTGFENPDIFCPNELNTDQWCDIISKGGMKGVIITAKHHDGFCLWPSRYTRHSVEYSKWKNGKGNVIGDLAKSCKKYGLKLGIYLSPADLFEIESEEGRYGNGSKPRTCKIPSDPAHQQEVEKVFEYDNLTDYDVYFMDQLYELLTEYGDIFEVWFDGANPKPGTGQTYNLEAQKDLIRKLQPNAVIAIGGPDVRWCGNEHGGTRISEYSVIPMYENPSVKIKYEGNMLENLAGRDKLINDKVKYLYWYPAETNTTIRQGWFYRDEKQHVRQTSELIDIWSRAIGGNTVLLLNLNPDKRGLIPQKDANNLLEMGEYVKETFKTNLAEGAKVITSSSQFRHKAKYITDNNEDTYWIADADDLKAEIIVDLGGKKTFNRVMMQEMISERGQRVESYSLYVGDDDKWEKLTDGTVIGYKSIDRFPTVTGDKLKVMISKTRANPSISFIGVYNGPVMLSEPIIKRSITGQVVLSCKSPDPEIYYTTDGSTPTLMSKKYTTPFYMKGKGLLKAIAYTKSDKKQSNVSIAEFGICKEKWNVIKASSTNNDRAIDDNFKTVWSAAGDDKLPNYICVDMGEVLDITGFTYMPARSGNGLIEKYNFYVSNDGKNWEIVKNGRFGNIKNNPVLQEVRFGKCLKTRYFKFESTAVIGNQTSIAEVGVL